MKHIWWPLLSPGCPWCPWERALRRWERASGVSPSVLWLSSHRHTHWCVAGWGRIVIRKPLLHSSTVTFLGKDNLPSCGAWPFTCSWLTLRLFRDKVPWQRIPWRSVPSELPAVNVIRVVWDYLVMLVESFLPFVVKKKKMGSSFLFLSGQMKVSELLP